MTDPTKEALDQDARDYLALQERCDQWRMRAEAAEAEYAALRATSIEKLRLDESARAEAAEKAHSKISGTLVAALCERNAAVQRAEAAETRLAELVREVRESVRTCQGNSALFAILNKYEKP